MSNDRPALVVGLESEVGKEDSANICIFAGLVWGVENKRLFTDFTFSLARGLITFFVEIERVDGDSISTQHIFSR